MRTYKMTISYDGTRYQGWQRQAMTDNTIQHILEWTIGRMVGYRVQVDGSGRTDSGVHARGQVASVKLSKIYVLSGWNWCAMDSTQERVPRERSMNII